MSIIFHRSKQLVKLSKQINEVEKKKTDKNRNFPVETKRI